MFVKYTQEQYRKLDADAFEARKAEVQKAIEDFDGSDKDLTMNDLKNEVRMIQEDTERRNLAVELRNAKAAQVAGGEGRIIAASEGQKSIRTAPAIQTIAPTQTDHERMLDSVVLIPSMRRMRRRVSSKEARSRSSSSWCSQTPRRARAKRAVSSRAGESPSKGRRSKTKSTS